MRRERREYHNTFGIEIIGEHKEQTKQIGEQNREKIDALHHQMKEKMSAKAIEVFCCIFFV